MGPPSLAFLAILAAVPGGWAQFQLAFGTTHAPGATVCADKLDNCALFAPGSCHGQYEAWAKDNCALSCQYCVGPPTTPLPCVDVLDNCGSFEDAACTSADYHAWAFANCRLHCRLCDAQQLVHITTTTIPPERCVDKLDCRLYGQTVCSGTYLHWAQENCMNSCGFCRGIPTTQPPCQDSRPDCSMYERTMCTDPQYAIWASDNCRKFCQFCGTTGGTTHPPILTPPPLALNPTLRTPPMPGRK